MVPRLASIIVRIMLYLTRYRVKTEVVFCRKLCICIFAYGNGQVFMNLGGASYEAESESQFGGLPMIRKFSARREVYMGLLFFPRIPPPPHPFAMENRH